MLLVKRKNKNIKGLSLIEIMIVITIFAVIGLLSSRSIFLTIRGAKKSDSLIRVRENVNYSLSVIERQIRNAQEITCPNPSTLRVDYLPSDSLQESSFSCLSVGPTNGYIASGSARLTSNDISITACSFSCIQTDINTPPVVNVSISAQDTVSQSVEKGSVSIETQITLRNY